MSLKNLQKYQTKAEASFTTKMNLYFFNKAILQDWENMSLEDFRNFIISSDLIDIYTTEYWQYEPGYVLKPGLTNETIYKQIDTKMKEYKHFIGELKNDYNNNQFPFIFPATEFDNMLKASECAYCHITTDEIIRLAVTIRPRA